MNTTSTTVSAAQIDARIDRLPSDASLWSWVLRISLGGFLEVYDLALTAPLSPLLVKAGIFQKDVAGTFGFHDLATFSFVTLAGLYVGSLGFSSFADRYSRRTVFVTSMIVYSVASVMMSLQDTAAGVFLWRFLAGVALGVELVVVDCYLGEISPKALRGRVFSLSKFLQMCAIPVASGLAFGIGSDVWLGIAGWRWVSFLPALGAVVVLILRRGIPESPRWLAARGRLQDADAIVTAIESRMRADGRTLPEPQPVAASAPSSGIRWRDLFQLPHRPRVLMLIVATSTSSIGFYGFAHWAPTLLEHQGVSTHKSLLYTTLIGVAYPLAPLLASLFSDRIERRLQMALSALLISGLGLVFSQVSTPAAWLASGVLMVLFSEMKSTAAHTYRAELFPTAIRSKAVGFVYSFSRLTAALSGYLIATVLALAGVTGVFVCLALLMCFSAAVTLVWGPKTLGRSFEEIEDPRPRRTQRIVALEHRNSIS